jgi:hypothetical protein
MSTAVIKGIIEFWLVNLKQKVIEVHTQPENESYQ